MVSKWWTHGEAPSDGRPDRWYDEGLDVVVGDAFCMVRLSGGERGCAWSHVRAWLEWFSGAAATPDSETPPLMVLEDDVVMSSQMPGGRCLDVIRSALHDVRGEPPDLLYLGWGHWSPWRRVVAESRGGEVEPYSIVEAEYPCTSHAYVIWPTGLVKLLECLPVDAPFDHWLARACSSRKITSYCVVEGSHAGDAMPGDGSDDGDIWGGVIRQHRQDEPDTGSLGLHPTEMMLHHLASRSDPPPFQAHLPVDPSTLRVLDISGSSSE